MDEKLDIDMQANEIIELGNEVLEAFIRGYGKDLSPFQKDMFKIGFSMGIIFDKFNEEESELIMNLIIDKI